MKYLKAFWETFKKPITKIIIGIVIIISMIPFALIANFLLNLIPIKVAEIALITLLGGLCLVWIIMEFIIVFGWIGRKIHEFKYNLRKETEINDKRGV